MGWQAKMSLKVDLHCHSQASDGSLSYQALIERAIEQGVDLLAITDHDTTTVHPRAAEFAKNLPIQIIPAVEISAITDNQELHIVALGIDINHQPLQQLLEQNRQSRYIRATKILEKLQKAGYADFTEQLHQLLTGDVVCRSHLAQLLCDAGICKNFQKAFKRYLGKQGKAWVSIQWPELSLVIQQIKAAGGIAVLAHPSKYKLSNSRLAMIIQSFVTAGGVALEVAYPGLNPSDRALLLRQVEQHQLAVSQGSDFHHPGTNWTELGTFGINPQSFKAVWQHYQLAIHTG